MINKLLKIFKKEYSTLNKIEISKNNLIYNYRYLSSVNRKVKIAPVLKSNAYGHGIKEVAKILDNAKAPFLCVDSLYEAYELYKVNIKTPILIMGYTNPENFKVKKLPFSYAVFGALETLKILNKYQPGCGIHIFVDTGMHREGIPLDELLLFLDHIKSYPNLKVEGLMSHLASANDRKDALNKIQISNFKKALGICRKKGVNIKWFHLSNSDGLYNSTVSTYHTSSSLSLRAQSLRVEDPGVYNAHTVYNVARVGLVLYGISKDPNLKPVLTLKSKIIQIKKLRKGDRVGYGGTFKAKKSMILGVLPIGYYDGVDLRLSDKGFVKVDGAFCPIVGRISMNITTIDITKLSEPYIGQEVIIYSANPSDKNSVKATARFCKTIPYDILIHLAASTKRVVI
ncbi:MAG: alanine racemase [Patescibacteria group bacterium]